MVKVWGYDKHACPSKMFFPQSLKSLSSTREKRTPQKIFMKLPSNFDIQRLVLARHLIYLNYPGVLKGKKLSPKGFEDDVAELKRQGIYKWTGYGIMRKKRKSRTVTKGKDVSPEMTSHGENGKAKWDIAAMSYKNILLELNYDCIVSKIKAREIKRELHQDTPSAEAIEILRKEQEEMNERRTWCSKMIRDRKSDRINEILANHRMVTQNCDVIGFHQPVYSICLEIAHYALKVHDWVLLSKCLCEILEILRKLEYRSDIASAPNALWMFGFLTLINYRKNDVRILEQFAKHVRTLMDCNPVWLSSHLAVWLIQKGYFMAAHRIVEEYSLDHLKKITRYRRYEFTGEENPKRDLALFITHLIKAVYLYCIWKKETVTPAADIDKEDDLKRKGEAALRAYESCFELFKAIEGDPMCFLQPFIELLVEFRSVFRAREILEEVFNLNDGHFFVEEFFIEFLEEHFAHSEDDQELIRFLKGRTERKFNYMNEDVKFKKRKASVQIRALKSQMRERNREKPPTMKEISKPAFSW